MEKNIKIALDGHSSCGKSTLAKQLAAHYGFLFIDTGAMYRAVALYAIENGIINDDDVIDEKKLKNEMDKINISFKNSNGKNRTLLNSEDVEDKIRQIRVSSKVSKIAAMPFVREKMVSLQRKISENSSVVMDGRDIGTVVFPNAEVKFFVTASLEIRAQRRYKELFEKGEIVDLEQIKQSISQRDFLDSTREISPLKKADDAIELDNSFMTREEQFDFAVKIIDKVLQK
ncbi:MAG: (d)CMP kinase [Bacteroidales bacterium]|nr:(d)CMP kinase [Bacteroidales bacterium]